MAVLHRAEVGAHVEVADIRHRYLVVHLGRDGRGIEHRRLQVAVVHGQRQSAQRHHTGRIGIPQGAIEAIAHLRIGLQSND